MSEGYLSPGFSLETVHHIIVFYFLSQWIDFKAIMFFSTGMWSHTMTVQDYQDLIDRGWRR